MGFFSAEAAGPEPMTDQDLQDWSALIDARAQCDRDRGVTRDGVINAGQAPVNVINGRKGRK